jgi:hypothetical protein
VYTLFFSIWTKYVLKRKEMGGAAKNRRAKKIKLLQNTLGSKTICDKFNK